MKIRSLVGPMLLGSFALPGVASAQVEATHSTGAGTGTLMARVAVTMRHVGARTTHLEATPPSAVAPSKESATTRAARLPAVSFRH